MHELKERAVAVGRAQGRVRIRQLLLQERCARIDELLQKQDLVRRRRAVARRREFAEERAARGERV